MASHDNLFRRTFADPELAGAMFRLVLPARLVEAIDWRTLHAVAPDIVDDDLAEHCLDLAFAVRLVAHDVWLLLIAEHKSEADPDLALQVLRYTLALLLRWREEHKGALGLPPVIPVLFHHGDRPYRTPTSLLGHFDLGGLARVRERDPELARIIAGLAVSLSAHALDLGERDEAWLRSSGLPPIVQLVCLVMRFVRFQAPDDGVASLDRWGDVLRAVLAAPGGQSQFAGVVSYLLEITDLSPEQLRGVVERAVGDGERIMGTAERLRNEGYARGKADGISLGKAEGKAEGMAEGKAEGAVEGRAQALIQFIGRRFGSPSDDVVARVLGARPGELDVWIDRVLDAPTLASLLGDE